MLTLTSIKKDFGRFTALEDISLAFSNGIYGLLAPNGAGKTTLLSLITTLYRPSAGEILYGGEDIYLMDERYRQIIGYLPQEFGYYPHYTARRFLRYISTLKGLDATYADQKITEVLRLTGLEKHGDQKLKTYSGGMRQRIGIAQALLNDPQILILDEPTAGLDPKERVRFRNILTNLSLDKTIILSTHIVSDIETIAQEIIMLKDRRVFCQDTPRNICSRLDGKIYEITAAEKQPASSMLLTERQENGQLIRRVYSSTPPSAASRPVPSTLEDVFLHTYQEEGN